MYFTIIYGIVELARMFRTIKLSHFEILLGYTMA